MLRHDKLTHSSILEMRVKDGGFITFVPECKTFGFTVCRQSRRKRGNFTGNGERQRVREGNQLAPTAMFKQPQDHVFLRDLLGLQATCPLKCMLGKRAKARV